MTAEADATIDRERTARDRLVDGLLRTRHELPIDRERRVAAAMRLVRRDFAEAHPVRRIARAAGGLAAIAAVMVAAVMLTPREVSAADRARAMVQRERAGNDRRVMFVLHPPQVHANRPPLTGTLDVRDARHMVLTLRMPDGREEVRGVNGDAAWRIGPDGAHHSEPADHPWPVWIRSPRGGLIVDMADAIESGLVPGWTWSVTRGTGEDHLLATRDGGPGGEPNRIEATIDTMTGRVRRVEIAWPQPAAPFEPGSHRPPPPPDGDMSRGDDRPRPGDDLIPGGLDPADGQRPPPHAPGGAPDHGPRPPRGPMSPVGAPGGMVIVPEPPITFPADWFTAARHGAGQ